MQKKPEKMIKILLTFVRVELICLIIFFLIGVMFVALFILIFSFSFFMRIHDKMYLFIWFGPGGWCGVFIYFVRTHDEPNEQMTQKRNEKKLLQKLNIVENE